MCLTHSLFKLTFSLKRLQYLLKCPRLIFHNFWKTCYAPLRLELSCLSFMYLISVTTGYRGTSLGLFLPRFRTFINSDSSIKSLLTRPPRESFQTNTKINSTIWPYQCHVAFKSKNIKSPEYWQCTQIYFMRLPNDIVDIYLLPGWYRSNLSRIHRNYLDP